MNKKHQEGKNKPTLRADVSLFDFITRVVQVGYI